MYCFLKEIIMRLLFPHNTALVLVQDFIWFERLPELAKHLPQFLHICGLAPVCVFSWSRKVLPPWKVFPQYWHLNFFSGRLMSCLNWRWIFITDVPIISPQSAHGSLIWWAEKWWWTIGKSVEYHFPCYYLLRDNFLKHFSLVWALPIMSQL